MKKSERDFITERLERKTGKPAEKVNEAVASHIASRLAEKTAERPHGGDAIQQTIAANVPKVKKG